MNNLPTGAFSSRQEKTPSGYRQFAQNMYTPEQEQAYSGAFGMLGPDSFTSRLARGDQGAFAEMEAPAMQQFNALQGNISSRFSGMGQGARNSSGFQNTMSQAGQDFASQLQANRLQLRNQAIKDMMGMTSEFLGYRPQEKGLVNKRQKQPTWLQQGFLQASKGLGQGLGMAATGGMG